MTVKELRDKLNDIMATGWGNTEIVVLKDAPTSEPRTIIDVDGNYFFEGELVPYAAIGTMYDEDYLTAKATIIIPDDTDKLTIEEAKKALDNLIERIRELEGNKEE